MKVVKDQMGYVTSLNNIQRIVCLVPSITELLCELGLEDKIVGITKFCIHPESCYRSKIRVGGTKDFDIETIKLLQPDIIIANKEENDKELLLRLKLIYPVWISDVKTVEDAKEMILMLGDVFNSEEKASQIVNNINFEFDKLDSLKKKYKAAYLIWKNPYMSINKDTYIHDLLEKCGFENLFSKSDVRYPKISEELLKKSKPDVILLSSEPYPFKEKHLEELTKLCPKSRIFLVDGEMFSWYGSRMKFAPQFFNQLIQKLNSTSLSLSLQSQ